MKHKPEHKTNVPELGKARLLLFDITQYIYQRFVVFYKHMFSQFDLNSNSRRNLKTQICFEFSGQSLVMNEHSENCTIGHDAANSIWVTHSASTRTHAIITFNQGAYVLENLSVNGTYVIKKDKPPIFVLRDTLTLDGFGIIAAGFLPENEIEDTIFFATSENWQSSQQLRLE